MPEGGCASHGYDPDMDVRAQKLYNSIDLEAKLRVKVLGVKSESSGLCQVTI